MKTAIRNAAGIGLACVALCATTDAGAQSRARSVDERVVNSISGNEVIALMRSLSAPTSLSSESKADNEKTLEARAGDGMVYIFLSGCNGPGAFAQCNEIQPTVYFNGAGVTLGQLNAFNLDADVGSVAGLLEDGRGVVFVRRTLVGGVTASHVRATIQDFLDDAEALLKSIDPTGSPSIRLPASAATGAARLFPAGGATPKTNDVGANAPSFTPDAD